MASKKSSSRSAKTGAITGHTKAKTSGKINKLSSAKVGGEKLLRTKTTRHKVNKGAPKRVSAAGTTGESKVGPLLFEKGALHQLRVAKMPVTGRLVESGTIDRNHAKILEEFIAGATEVTISTGSGKAVTLTGALLSVIRGVVSALEHGESVTVLGEDTDADLEGAVISSQVAADLLNVSRPFVVKLAKTGQLPHHMVGNRHRFNLADVLAYADRMRAVRSEALASIAPVGGYTAEDF